MKRRGVDEGGMVVVVIEAVIEADTEVAVVVEVEVEDVVGDDGEYPETKPEAVVAVYVYNCACSPRRYQGIPS